MSHKQIPVFFPAQILKQALVEDKTDGRGNSVSAGASRRARTSITPSSISPAILLTARWYMQICNPGRAKTPDLSLVTLLPLWAWLRCSTVRKEVSQAPRRSRREERGVLKPLTVPLGGFHVTHSVDAHLIKISKRRMSVRQPIPLFLLVPYRSRPV